MGITHIDSLPRADGLKLHKDFAEFSRAEFSVAILTGTQSTLSFGGKPYEDVRALGDALTKKMHVPDSKMLGFTGNHILSCHFSASAYDDFRDTFKVQNQNDLIFQFTANEYWVQAVVQWGNERNKGLARMFPKQQIKIEEVGNAFNTYNLVFPNIDVMQEFETRRQRGFLDVEARNIELAQAGVKLEQHVI